MSNHAGRRIGLTGGIAAGKSTVSAALRAQGIYVLDADEAARRAVEPGSPGLAALAQRYGKGILLEDGALNRAALGKIIFSAESEREAVNAILHPLIIADMQAKEAAYLSANPGKPVVWDVPLLIEAGQHTQMQEIWLVVAEEHLRIQRMMRRDGMTEEEAYKRLRSQMPQEEKLRYADVVLENNTTKEALLAQVRRALKRV